VEIVLDGGRTLAAQGEPDGGGVSLSLSMLWPVEERYRIGLMAFADGLGEQSQRLVGPGGDDLGPIAGVHRAVRGVAVRVEAHAPRWVGLEPYLAANWGFCRAEDDVRGTSLGGHDAASIGLGAGLLRRFNEHHAAGIGLRAQHLSRGEAGRYAGATLEWRWNIGAGE